MKSSTIQYALENGTSEALVKDWAETCFRMSNGKPEFKGTWTLEQHYEFCNKEVEKVRDEIAEPVETFFIALLYNEVTLRDKVKGLGGKWNPTSKVWAVTCKRSQLGNLESRISKRGNSVEMKSIFGVSADCEEEMM
jgi:hypothetical protein